MPKKWTDEEREALTNAWQIGMFEAPIKSPCHFCFNGIFPCYEAFKHRTEMLDDMASWTCCQGTVPCTDFLTGMFKDCPQVGLCLEVSCCLQCAVSANRYLIQSEFGLEESCCDQCLQWAVVAAQCVACIMRMMDMEGADEASCLADILYCVVLSCMQTQHEVEINHQIRSSADGPEEIQMGVPPPGHGGPPGATYHNPPPQQMQMQMPQPGQQQGLYGPVGGGPGPQYMGGPPQPHMGPPPQAHMGGPPQPYQTQPQGFPQAGPPQGYPAQPQGYPAAPPPGAFPTAGPPQYR